MATPSAYGKDIRCLDDVKSGRYATGPRLVAEACYRRLTTPRGMLRGGEDEADYGIDLTDFVGHANPKAAAAALPNVIENELLKDERVEEVVVTCTLRRDGAAFAIDVNVQVTTGEGPFDLKLSVSDVTVSLLGIST